MTPAEYRSILKALDISQVRAAKMLGVAPTRSNGWATGAHVIPKTAERFLHYIVATNGTPETVINACASIEAEDACDDQVGESFDIKSRIVRFLFSGRATVGAIRARIQDKRLTTGVLLGHLGELESAGIIVARRQSARKRTPGRPPLSPHYELANPVDETA